MKNSGKSTKENKFCSNTRHDNFLISTSEIDSDIKRQRGFIIFSIPLVCKHVDLLAPWECLSS